MFFSKMLGTHVGAPGAYFIMVMGACFGLFRARFRAHFLHDETACGVARSSFWLQVAGGRNEDHIVVPLIVEQVVAS